MNSRALVTGYDNGRRDFRGVSLQGQDLSGITLAGIRLAGANLTAARFRGTDLCGADLRRISAWGATLRDATLRSADLTGADLAMADLVWADLREASLRSASLRGARLAGATFQAADLRHADLRLADLWQADLRLSDLRGADLSGADLRQARLRESTWDSTTNTHWAMMHPTEALAQGRWSTARSVKCSLMPPSPWTSVPPSRPRTVAHAAELQEDSRWTDAYLRHCRCERALFLQLLDQHSAVDPHQAAVAARRELGLRVRQMRAAMDDEQARAIWSASGVCACCGKPIHPGDPYRLRPQGRMACHACDLGIPVAPDARQPSAELAVRPDGDHAPATWLGRAKSFLQQLWPWSN